MSSSTISCFANLIVVENLFCINRCYLIDCPRKKLIGNTIFLFTFTCLVAVVILDLLLSNISLGVRMFQGYLAVEFFDLVITARIRSNSFDALKRLDEKCGFGIDYIEKLAASSSNYTIFVIACAVLDLTGLVVLRSSLCEVITFFVLFSAQDAELIFFSMIVEAINLRLSELRDMSPVFGSKVYRHVLFTTALMNEEVSPRIIILLAVVLGSTVTYSSVVILSLADTDVQILSYLLWRELKVFFCLWRVCYVSARSESICQQLAFQLAKKLALDPDFDKAKNVQSHLVLGRWWRAVVRERPGFMRGSALAIGLAVPLHLLDVSVNYVLIIVQIYVAYN